MSTRYDPERIAELTANYVTSFDDEEIMGEHAVIVELLELVEAQNRVLQCMEPYILRCLKDHNLILTLLIHCRTMPL